MFKLYQSVKKSLVVATVLTAGVVAPSAHAAKGSTDVTLIFPDILILHYISDLTLTFDAEFKDAIDEGSAEDSAVLAPTADFDAAIEPSDPDPVFPENVEVTANNVWAVRGITADGTIKIAATLDSDTASNEESTVVASKIAPTEELVKAPGLFKPVSGGVTFNLDVTGLTRSGKHTGMTYTIEATAP